MSFTCWVMGRRGCVAATCGKDEERKERCEVEEGVNTFFLYVCVTQNRTGFESEATGFTTGAAGVGWRPTVTPPLRFV